jgi:hypothetical protein
MGGIEAMSIAQRARDSAKRTPLAARLLRNTMPVTECGCWIWLGCLNRQGYGSIGDENYKPQLVHRMSWQVFRGPIPDELHVLHACDVPSCINPDHLFLGTNLDNVADKVKKDRCYRVRLSDEEISDICNSPLSVTKIGKVYGISRSAAWVIRRKHRGERHVYR